MYNFKPSFVPIESPDITFQIPIHSIGITIYKWWYAFACIITWFFQKKNLYSSVYVPSLEIRILTYPNLWNILNYTWFLKTKPPYKAIKHFKNKLYLRIYQWMNETFFISTYVLFFDAKSPWQKCSFHF